MADPRIYPTYFDTYTRTKNRPFMKRKKGDVMNIGPDMSATPGYVDPSLPLTQKYLTGPLKQKAFVTAPTQEQKDAMYKPSYMKQQRQPKYTDSLFPTLPSVPGVDPYFDYETLDWRTSLDRFGKEFLDSEKGGTGFSLKTPEQGANYSTVNWSDAGFTAPNQGITTGEEEVYFNPTSRQVVRAPHKGFIAPEGWISLKGNIKPIAPDSPEDFSRGPEPPKTVTDVYYTWDEEEVGQGDWDTVRTTHKRQVANPEWTTWSQTPDIVRDTYEKDLAEFEESMRIYEEKQAQIEEFEDFDPEFELDYDPDLAGEPGGLMDQAVRLFKNFNVPMRIDPVSGKLIINNKVMNSIQDLRNEHRKLVGQTGVGTFDIPVGMDPATFYRNNPMFQGAGSATYYYNQRGTLNPYGDVWAETIDPTQDVLPQIQQIIMRQEAEDTSTTDDGDPDQGEPSDEPGGISDMGGNPAGTPDEFGGGHGPGGTPGDAPGEDEGDTAGGGAEGEGDDTGGPI